MKPIIKVQDVSKQFRIGARGASYQTLRDLLAESVKSPFAKLRRARETSDAATIWALKDVSFEVQPGEVVGIIGRNGAGKSTLLKMLSRITEPTRGRIDLYGRIGSLLEVGTGFHPELTGRENVFLYGAILGMARAEIKRKFDEIVAFSEIEKFIDTPVKHYSSGMYMRLAFSVPAHLEPEIMLVDEVLAVGDMAFQRKCLERIKRMKQSGLTILLVSHNMSAIQSTCERSIYLDQGGIQAIGDSSSVIKRYRDATQRRSSEAPRPDLQSSAAAEVQITNFEMFGSDGVSRRTFQFGESVRIRIELHASKRIETPVINLGIKRSDGVIVCNFNNWFDNFKIDYIEGKCTLDGWLPPLRLISYSYEAHVLVLQRLGNYAQGDLSRLRPLAADIFGDFSIEGLPLTDQDGVYQEPARKWVFQRGGERVEYTGMTENSLAQAFDGEQAIVSETLLN